MSLLLFTLWVAPLPVWNWSYPQFFSSIDGHPLSFPSPGPTEYRIVFCRGSLTFYYLEPYGGGSRNHPLYRDPGSRWIPFFRQAPNPHLGRRWAVALPLWIPFLLVTVPTAILWWRDRRRISPGHCQKCGYDLTGNVSGVCPECGEPT